MSKEKENIQELLETDRIAGDLERYMESEGAKLQAESRTTEQIPLKLDKRLARTVRSSQRSQKPCRRMVKRTLLIAAILMALVAAPHVSAIRAVVFNYILTWRQESMDFSESAHSEQYTWNIDTPLPKDLPTGYQLTNAVGYQGVMKFVYSCSGKKDIQLKIYEDKTSVRLDSEDPDEIGRITINGQEGYYIIKGDLFLMFWNKSPAFQLEGPNSEKDAMIRMAESIVNLPAGG